MMHLGNGDMENEVKWLTWPGDRQACYISATVLASNA